MADLVDWLGGAATSALTTHAADDELRPTIADASYRAGINTGRRRRLLKKVKETSPAWYEKCAQVLRGEPYTPFLKAGKIGICGTMCTATSQTPTNGAAGFIWTLEAITDRHVEYTIF